MATSIREIPVTRASGQGIGAVFSRPRDLAWQGRGLTLSTAILLAGIAALAVPTIFSLARDYWSTDNGAYGPILLISGIWLIWRESQDLRPSVSPRAQLGALATQPPLLLLYAYGRVFRILTVESAALYGILLALAFAYLGSSAVRRHWFLALYLAFLIRPPSSAVAEMTQPLKIWISDTTTSLLHALDYPVGNSGVRIQIGQYELMVQQACAGLGSIFSLVAIGLLYMYLSRQRSAGQTILLVAGIVPVAVAANLLRVMILVLLTYYFGEHVAQGFAHEAAGVTTFLLSLLGMAVLDSVLRATRREPRASDV